jgi:chromosome segregation ATPase
MITLDQIHLLDEKVQKAVDQINTLKDENEKLLLDKEQLTEKLAEYEKRIAELEVLVGEFKNGQGEIEQGIINAINRLETIENPTQKDIELSTEPKVDSSNSKAPSEDHEDQKKEEQSKLTKSDENTKENKNKQIAELDIF